MVGDNHNGFSMVEVLIAITIFAIFLTGFAQVLIHTFHASAQAKHMTAAVTLAQEKVEELRGLDPLVSGADTTTLLGVGTLTRSWTVGGGPTAATSIATVGVSWTDTKTRTFQLDTVIRP